MTKENTRGLHTDTMPCPACVEANKRAFKKWQKLSQEQKDFLLSYGVLAPKNVTEPRTYGIPAKKGG